MKIFLSDMDGTLLDSNKRLPQNINKLIEKLNSQNATFGIVSGRSYANLATLFNTYLDKMILICDNGSNVFYHNKEIIKEVIDKELLKKAVARIRDLDYAQHVYCASDNKFYIDKMSNDPYILKNIDNYYPNYIYKEDILNADIEIIKIAIISEKQITEVYELLKDFQDVLKITISAKDWVDINKLGSNKAQALMKLAEIKKIDHSNIYVFGDHLNDLELFKYFKNSFAVSNAHDDILKLASKIIGSNDDNSVVKEIARIAKIDL